MTPVDDLSGASGQRSFSRRPIPSRPRGSRPSSPGTARSHSSTSSATRRSWCSLSIRSTTTPPKCRPPRLRGRGGRFGRDDRRQPRRRRGPSRGRVGGVGDAATIRRHAGTARRGSRLRAEWTRNDAVRPPRLAAPSRSGELQRNVLQPRGMLLNGFTEREIEVLRLVADGLGTGEIAEKLSYSGAHREERPPRGDDRASTCAIAATPGRQCALRAGVIDLSALRRRTQVGLRRRRPRWPDRQPTPRAVGTVPRHEFFTLCHARR